MGDSRLTPTLLAADPSAFREILLTGSASIEGAYPAGFLLHAKIIAGVYGLMLAAVVWACWARQARGKLRLISRNKQGILRPNAPIAVQLLIGVYCIFWIALICADVLRHDRSPRQGMQTFHLVVFIPLSLAGWLQVYGTICAIPVRSAMINEGQRKPVYRSLSTRVIESHHLRNLMLLVIPSLYILLLMVPAILTGTYQKRSFASADRVVAGLDRAIADGGWSSLQALAECGREALELESNYKTLQRYVRWCCCVVMVWVLLDLAMYATACTMVWRILNRQLSQLRRSIANAATLRRLSRPLAGPSNESQTSKTALFPPSKLSWEDSKKAPPTETPWAPNEGRQESFEAKLRRTELFKKVFAFQAAATIYIEIIGVGYASFGIANGFFRVDREALRAIPLFVPIYGFILPAALPSSLLNTYFFIRHNSPIDPPAPTAPMTPRAPSAEVGQDDFAPASPQVEQWQLELSRNAAFRADDQSKGVGSAGGSSESYTGTEANSAISPRKGRPSEWAKTASQRF